MKQGLRVISGKLIDIIEPFPEAHLKRVWGWMRRFKSLTFGDDIPKGRKEFTAWLHNTARSIRTYGIVDRDDKLGKGSPSLVGIVFYEPFSTTNGYMHMATSMQAFGKKFADDAGRVVTEDLFTVPHPMSPKLLRISATPPDDNWMAKKLLARIGFDKEGTIHDMYNYKGEPVSCDLYGLTRKQWHTLTLETTLRANETVDPLGKTGHLRTDSPISPSATVLEDGGLNQKDHPPAVSKKAEEEIKATTTSSWISSDQPWEPTEKEETVLSVEKSLPNLPKVAPKE